MNKTAIKNYAIWARVNLIEAVKQKAYQYEITKDSITDAVATVVAGKPLSRDEIEQRRQLISQINCKGFDQVMEEVAYTWFNRFIALRFMEVNGYLPSQVRVFTDSEGNFKPEILKEALTVDLQIDRSRVMELLEKQDKVGIYRLENKLINGTGKFSPKNVEGLSGAPKAVRDSLMAAFNYFNEKATKMVGRCYDDFDYSLYFNDLQKRGVSEEVSVAEVVALFSALSGRPVMNSLIICGRVVMSGTMMPLTTELDDILVASINAGAKSILLPSDSEGKYKMLSDDIKTGIEPIFYSTPLEAVKKALSITD